MRAHAPYSEYTIKWATLPWEQRQAMALRRRVFCQEQALFDDDDRDAIDARAQLLVAVGAVAGWHEQVVGTVRIHQQAPGVWLGSRLAVEAGFRGQGQLVAALIRLAVSSACGLGCEQFLARVQKRNESLFERLHWTSLGEEVLHNHPHVWMRADLTHYPPHHTPRSGLVVRGTTRACRDDLAPDLLQLRVAPTPAACRLQIAG